MWRPTPEEAQNCRLGQFLRWCCVHNGVRAATYRQAWEWSVGDPSAFWSAVREYFDVIGDGFDDPALAGDTMPGAKWFPSARLNFAENVLRYASTPVLVDAPAIISLTETNEESRISWGELAAQVAARPQQLLGAEQRQRRRALQPVEAQDEDAEPRVH